MSVLLFSPSCNIPAGVDHTEPERCHLQQRSSALCPHGDLQICSLWGKHPPAFAFLKSLRASLPSVCRSGFYSPTLLVHVAHHPRERNVPCVPAAAKMPSACLSPCRTLPQLQLLFPLLGSKSGELEKRGGQGLGPSR